MNTSTLSDAAGSFSVPNLPVGDYLVCAEAPGPYLNPCKWSSAQRVTISANATVTQALALKKGVFLRVSANDPLGILSGTPGPLGGAKLIAGVIFGGGAFLAASDSGVYTAGMNAKAVLDIETDLAKASLTRVEKRDPYHRPRRES